MLQKRGRKRKVADLQRPVDTASVHAVQPVPPSSVSCHRCGGKHNASSCRVKSAVCYNCGKPGHFARVCRSAPKRGRKKTNMRLRTYTGEMLVIKGRISVSVCCRSVRALLDLLVVAGTGPSLQLMGRNWLHKLKPALSVFHTRADNDVQELLGRHEARTCSKTSWAC